MPYKLSSNLKKHAGKSYEWLFFHDPSYATWIIENNITNQRHNFSEEEGEHFEEIYRRASHLTGVCHWCRQRPLTQLGIRYSNHGSPSYADFYCRDCQGRSGCVTEASPPAIILPRRLRDCEQARIIDAVKRQYSGDPHLKLTQHRMEEFFRRDDFFVNATPEFYAAEGG